MKTMTFFVTLMMMSTVAQAQMTWRDRLAGFGARVLGLEKPAPVPAPDKPLKDLMASVGNDLFWMREKFVNQNRATPGQVKENTALLINSLNAADLPRDTDKRPALAATEINEILWKMNSHPVVGPAGSRTYDPESRFGFCFGRAQWAYIELLQRGVAKPSIKKIFAVGPMHSGGIDWQFHVATIVRAENGQWMTIDNYVGRVMTVEDWVQQLNKVSTDGKLMFYVTEPGRLGPSTTWRFNKRSFKGPGFDEAYTKYFEEMMKSFKAVSDAKADEARRARADATSRSCAKVFAVVR